MTIYGQLPAWDNEETLDQAATNTSPEVLENQGALASARLSDGPETAIITAEFTEAAAPVETNQDRPAAKTEATNDQQFQVATEDRPIAGLIPSSF